MVRYPTNNGDDRPFTYAYRHLGGFLELSIVYPALSIHIDDISATESLPDALEFCEPCAYSHEL